MLDKPADAVPFLAQACAEDSENVKAFLYLGMAYQQLEQTDDAIAVYLKVLPRAGKDTARIAYNLANAYYGKNDGMKADEYYSAAINADSGFASAYLNRGNARLRTGNIDDALADYDEYLALEPRSVKRPQIERIKALVIEERDAAEQRRIAAEETARAEAERRQQFFDEVTASLKTLAQQFTGLSAERQPEMVLPVYSIEESYLSVPLIQNRDTLERDK